MNQRKKTYEFIKEMGQFSWKNPKNNQELALSVLKGFLNEYRKTKPDKHLERNYCIYLSRYLINLFAIRNALYEEDYGTACQELYALEHYCGIYQIRIYANLVKLLEKYCVAV